MAYSYDDHILNLIGPNLKVPHIIIKVGDNFKVSNTNLTDNKINESILIIKDILHKYSSKFKEIKKDFDFIGTDGISLEVRVNNGYDFHDFDVVYRDVEKVINYYLLIKKTQASCKY